MRGVDQTTKELGEHPALDTRRLSRRRGQKNEMFPWFALNENPIGNLPCASSIRADAMTLPSVAPARKYTTVSWPVKPSVIGVTQTCKSLPRLLGAPGQLQPQRRLSPMRSRRS
jgi:hypothetical protein